MTPPEAPGRGWIERIPAYTVPLLLLGIPLLFALVAQISPDFYDQVVWKYYWGPIKADAEGGGCQSWNGVEACAGYNLVNTASWAVLLGLCIVGTGQLLQRFKTRMDNTLIVAATLWVVAGSLFHVLEDAKMFAVPLRYLFITPIIYLIFAAFGVLSLVIGHYLRAVAERRGLPAALQKLWLLLCIPVLGYLFLDLSDWTQLNHYVSPISVALFALVPFVVAAWRFQRLGRFDPSELVAILSIGWILAGTAALLEFAQSPWEAYMGVRRPILHALWSPLLALAVVFIVWGIARALRKKHPVGAAAYMLPINGLIIFAQMLDAFATSMGIDVGRLLGHGYTEKHVLSAGLIDVTRQFGERTGIQVFIDFPTFLGFAPVKLLVSLMVIYAIDVSNPKESQRYPTLIGLVKFAIIMVGIGPGIRDFVRMALGI